MVSCVASKFVVAKVGGIALIVRFDLEVSQMASILGLPYVDVEVRGAAKLGKGLFSTTQERYDIDSRDH